MTKCDVNIYVKKDSNYVLNYFFKARLMLFRSIISKTHCPFGKNGKMRVYFRQLPSLGRKITSTNNILDMLEIED